MTRRTSRYLTLGAAVAAFAATLTEPPRVEEAQLTPAAICSHESAEPDDTREPEQPGRA